MVAKNFLRSGGSLLVISVLTGCGSLPSSGPSISNIKAQADRPSHVGKYAFVPVDQDVVDSLRKREITRGLSSLAAPSRPGDSALSGVARLQTVKSRKIAVGDVLAVSIYASGGGLFGASESGGNQGSGQSQATELPPQLVDDSGSITVPHIGRVKVLGRVPSEIENEITENLKQKVITPWTIVTIQGRVGNSMVTVAGDAREPKRVDIPPSGLRLIDAITSAGGSSVRDYETTVTVTRGGTSRSDLYGDIIRDTKKNVALESGDTIVLSGRHWTYTTLGATSQKLTPFPNAELTLAEALANADGLVDNRANPEAVFVYRFESPTLLQSLGQKGGASTPAGAPVIYQINLRQPDGLFLASQFAMRDKDILFIGNSGSVGMMKALGIFNAITTPAVQGASVATGIGTINALNSR